MKKYFYSVLAAGMLFATSCSQDQELVDITQGEGQTVTLKVSIPKTESRAIAEGVEIGKGNMATRLIYAQYEADDDDLLVAGIVDDTDKDKTFTVNLTMAKDINYDVLFMAYNPENNIFGIDPTVDDATEARSVNLRELTLKPELLANQEAYDAFVGLLDGANIKDGNKTVSLKRPFAQVNAITTKEDLAAAKTLDIEVTYSNLSIKNVPTTYDVLTGEATGATDVYTEYKSAEVLKNKDSQTYETFATDQYYLLTAYVLAGDNEYSNASTHDATLKFYRGTEGNECVSTLDIVGLPIQRNHRTNVMGHLLTKTEEYTVKIEEIFTESDKEVPVDEYKVSDINGLQKAINAAADNVPTTITLTADITDDATANVNSKAAEGTYWVNVPKTKNIILDLNGHTISHTKEQTTGYSLILNEGILTINDSQTNGKISYTDSGNGGEYVSNTISNYNTLIVNAGEIVNASSSTVANNGYPHAIDNNTTWNNTATLTINNGIITCQEYSAIRLFCGNVEKWNNATIINGTINGAIDLQNGSKDQACLGKLTIENGIFKKNKSSYNVRIADWHYYNSTASISGVKASISGGTFDGGIYKNINTVQDFITGGVFGADVTDFVAEGYGCLKVKENEYHVVYGIAYNEEEKTYTVSHADGLEWIASNVDAMGGFEGETIKLDADIDLFKGYMPDGDPITTAPIGDKNESAFKGTFDGQNHAIKNLYQNGWALNYAWGEYGSIGLFRELEDATVKNVIIEDMEALIEGGDISFIAGSATGDCTFENITIKNSTIGTYNNGCGGIIGWSGAGTYTFKNIKIGSDVVLGGLWGSFDSSIGGIVGQAEPGATYNFENVEINCRIDAYNDCTASYDYYNYRMCGMIIGRCEETTTINGSNYPDLSKYNFTFNNVVVNYGDWMNYHYCDPTPGHNNGRGMRVEPGYAYDGLPADYDHNQCTTHHMECIPFDQLIGGDQLGVKGLPAVEGVTVNYPKTYVKEVASKEELKNAIKEGRSVVLSGDVNYGTEQLAINAPITIDLGGHELTTGNTYGGISLKNGASIKNGTVKHQGTVVGIKAYQVESIEDVTIIISGKSAGGNAIGGICVQEGSDTYIGSLKNVTIKAENTDYTNIYGIETYNCGLYNREKPAIGSMENVTINVPDTGMKISANVGTAKKCDVNGDNIGINMHLKGQYIVSLTLEECTVTGGLAGIYAHDEEGKPNTNNCSLTLTYDAKTVINEGTNGDLVWEFEDECKSVVTLNKPE